MLEMGRYDELNAQLGDTEDYSDRAYGYRGIDLGTVVETYRLPRMILRGYPTGFWTGKPL